MPNPLGPNAAAFGLILPDLKAAAVFFVKKSY